MSGVVRREMSETPPQPPTDDAVEYVLTKYTWHFLLCILFFFAGSASWIWLQFEPVQCVSSSPTAPVVCTQSGIPGLAADAFFLASGIVLAFVAIGIIRGRQLVVLEW